MSRLLTPATYDQVQHSRAPMLYAAAVFASGVAASPFLWRPPSWWIVAILLLAVAGLYLTRKRALFSRAMATTSLAFLGALNFQLRPPQIMDSTILNYADRQEVVLTAHVVEPDLSFSNELSDNEAGVQDRHMLAIETESVRDGEQSVAISSKVRLNLYGKGNSLSDLEYGSRFYAMAKVHAPRNFRNPGAFDYEGYLHSKDVVAIASAKADAIKILPGFQGSKFEALRIRVHRSIIEHIHTLWPSTTAALVDAMVVGEDAFIDPDTRIDFQRSGTYHVLVVSGMNLGILVVVVFWVLRRFRLKEMTINIVAITVAVAYAFLTDAGAPIWRATLMLGLYLAARFFYRMRSMLNAIGVAGFGLLIVDPRALFSPSFQLTFLAVLIIAAIGVPILERTSQPYLRGLRALEATRYDAQLPPRVAQLRLDLRLIAARGSPATANAYTLRVLGLAVRAGLTGFDLVFISALMQAGLVLPMAFYFHRSTSMGLPANMAVVPLTSVLMPCAAAGVALSYVSMHLAMPFAWMAAISLRGITGIVTWLGGAQLADVRVPTPSMLAIAGTSLTIILAAFTARQKNFYAAGGLLLLAGSAFAVTAIPPRPDLRAGVLEITAIDVGQGDSTLIVSPDGHTLLVDSGGLPHWMHSSFDIGEQVVSSYLWSRHIHELDAVAVTHAHADHMGGMAAIIANFRPKELWLGIDTQSDDLRRLLTIARAFHVKIIERHAGDVFQFGWHTQIRILAPQRNLDAQSWRANDDSLVMKISYRATSVLMEGDAERGVEERIAHDFPQATLLKVAHHGSATSTIPTLLSAVHPRYAFISVGMRNPYGHPRREVLERLAEIHALTYRTDLTGALTFYCDGENVTTSFPALR